jgi:hypothetical protein
MKELIGNCLALLFAVTLLLTAAWVFGFDTDGVLYGHWPENDDHPTNWLDTALHPDAR